MITVIKKKLVNKNVVLVIIAFALFIFAMTLILQKFEISQQKPRVMKSIEKVFVSLTDERYNMTELLNLLDNGKIEIEGMVNINYINEAYVNKEIQNHLMGSEISFKTLRDDTNKEMSFETTYGYLGVELFSAFGYLDQDNLFVRVPEIYSETFVISTQNLKQQYESSLLYKLLGENAPQIEKEFSINGFPEIEYPNEIRLKTYFDDYLENNYEVLKLLYESSQVEKLDYKKEILVGDGYRISTGYSVSIPKEESNIFIKSISEFFNLENFLKETEAAIEFIVFLDQDKEISGLETEFTLYLNNKPGKMKFVFDFLGLENKFDDVILSIHLVEENSDFKIQINNVFEDSLRNIELDLIIEKPYKTNLISIDLDYNMISGESQLMYDVNIPEHLIGDGKLYLDSLNKEILYPEETAIEIFKLNIISILKLMNDMDLSFFQ